MSTTISILADIPEDLHDTLMSYLDTHPDWDQDRIFSAALSLFLVQYGPSDHRIARVYLDSLFKKDLPTAHPPTNLQPNHSPNPGASMTPRLPLPKRRS